MKSYFTSIEKVNDRFYGAVTDNNSQQLIYRTISHASHADAVIDVNNFLQNQNNETPGINNTYTPQTISNTTTYTAPQNTEQPVRRCCGR
jgi:hypothetical protein